MNRRFAIPAIALTMLLAACSGTAPTDAPVTSPPATQAPATDAPATDAPATDAPATDAPATDAPATDAPATDAPATDAPATDEPPVFEPLVGNVDIHGSSTVAPISNAVAEDIAEFSPGFSFSVGDEGTGTGFADFFCVGQADIADASRKIRADDPTREGDEEATQCANNGVEWVELKVGYDGIAVITSVNNPLNCVSFADLYALMGPESDDVRNWSDAQDLATELGSTTELPDAALSITAPGDESGTYDSFIELALASFISQRFPDDASANTHLRTPGDVYVASANDNAIIQGIAGFDTSLGFVGLHYAEENAATVKTLGVDKGDGNCVPATLESVLDGTYPISRALYIYPNLGRAAENAAVTGYVDYYLSFAGISNVAETGYVPMPADELQTVREAWTAVRPQ